VGSTDSNTHPGANIHINYEELAKHIVAQQREQSQQRDTPLVTSEPAAVCEVSLEEADHNTAAGNGAESREASASGLGPLLDNVFAGELASRSQIPMELSDYVPLGTTVPQRVKNKIWSNEFVDFRSLLPSVGEEPLAITVKAGKIELNHASSNRAPLTINQWTDAFLIFASIYLQKFPTEACNFIKYAFTIREISRSMWIKHREVTTNPSVVSGNLR
jgi:hypothetical protein